MCLYVPVCLCSYLRVCYIEVHDFLEGTRLVCLSVCHPACAVCFSFDSVWCVLPNRDQKNDGHKSENHPYVFILCVCVWMCLSAYGTCMLYRNSDTYGRKSGRKSKNRTCVTSHVVVSCVLCLHVFVCASVHGFLKWIRLVCLSVCLSVCMYACMHVCRVLCLYVPVCLFSY